MMKKVILGILICLSLGCLSLTFVGCDNSVLDQGEIIIPGDNGDSGEDTPPKHDEETIISAFDKKEKAKWSKVLIDILIDSPYFDSTCDFAIADLENGFTITSYSVIDMYLDEIGMLNDFVYSHLDQDFPYKLYINVNHNKTTLKILL